MRKIVRQGTFETNSSSSHSLVITKSTEVESHPSVWLHDGYLRLYDCDLEFERTPNKPLTTFKEKLGYLIASYRNNEDKIDEIVEVVKKLIPECSGIKFPQNGEFYLFGIEEEPRNYYGYIDHQSSGILKNYLTECNISFEEFLTNKKYIIIIDGDEYNMWGIFKESGLINEDFIEKEIDGYDLW